MNSDVLLSAPTEVEDGAEEILAAFFYEVPAEAGGKNLGLVLACADLTLYAVLDGLPKTFTALKQVCLPYGGVADVAASGKGGSVLWSDKSIQRILYYDRLGPNDVEPHMMRYARYVRYLAKPSFAGMGEGDGRSSLVRECGSSLVGETGDGGGGSSKVRECGSSLVEERDGGGGGGSSKVRKCGSSKVGETGDGGRKTGDGGQRSGDGNMQAAVGKPPSEIVKPASRCQVIREGEALSFDEKPFTFSGAKRWRNINLLRQANGEYVKCDKKLKGFFSKDKEANAFFEAAIEAEGQGRNGTGRYRMKT